MFSYINNGYYGIVNNKSSFYIDYYYQGSFLSNTRVATPNTQDWIVQSSNDDCFIITNRAGGKLLAYYGVGTFLGVSLVLNANSQWKLVPISEISTYGKFTDSCGSSGCDSNLGLMCGVNSLCTCINTYT